MSIGDLTVTNAFLLVDAYNVVEPVISTCDRKSVS